MSDPWFEALKKGCPNAKTPFGVNGHVSVPWEELRDWIAREVNQAGEQGAKGYWSYVSWASDMFERYCEMMVALRLLRRERDSLNRQVDRLLRERRYSGRRDGVVARVFGRLVRGGWGH